MSKTSSKKSARIGIISLGCAKALVDSERILTLLKAEGYEIAPDYQGAQAVIVNTCGFLDSAKAESYQAIAEALEENGKVIVTGCMGADPEVLKRFPKLLSASGPMQFERVIEAVHAAVPPPHAPYLDLVPPQGLRLTPKHYAYLKISEGCDHACSFCIIPHLRGKQVSRPANDILGEAEALVKAGVRELLVIAQDLTAYGIDLKHAASDWKGRQVKARLPELVRELGRLGAWIRLHYVYPHPIADELLPLMQEGLVLPYLDIPFQHASPQVLKAMRRPSFQDRTLERIRRWRERVPELALRSTFIVGFPGETEEDFRFLLEWLEAARLDRVGCFTYEAVEGAPANQLANQVPEKIKQERWERLMAAQKRISALKLKDKVGRRIEVLVDEVDNWGGIGRSIGDSPEVDGVVHLAGDLVMHPGDLIDAQVTKAEDYDLIATPIQCLRSWSNSWPPPANHKPMSAAMMNPKER
ncbi:MAG: 30S ribosomal protein S12 methylthiotransferase RimO [Alphaproteobacteria bacterium]|nr:30S ribosomal protein S12 methylthiotransferase RimO [Alphaproteobacteria bacterium]